ncbi:MAG TPA: DUF2007 domain-containing protein [Phenylobacterium sp.]|jgi:hypothetical protein|uniref:putative signal transducing protein n=1 Tax=Phenylobacterium sp. TaxID=1871053 RepID=UPI002D4198D3|nr:DUF2007 domain-containing protein [Phenylobacterium sp.]HZZ68263.1 DUF2007 domain-containing protein [Phenylobacterium sp.]
MVELLKTTDPVKLNVFKSLLEDAGLHPVVVEASAYPGVLPVRLLVTDDEAPQARRLIAEVERDLG